MKYFDVWLCLLCLNFISCNQTCSLETNRDGEKVAGVSILNWNLETFFDANFDGDEYTEFSNSSQGWNKDKYSVRLENLATVVKSGDFDIIVMEELEKQGQLYDIYNKLCSNFNMAKNYSFGAFAKAEGSSIGCGILSRYPLQDMSVHAMDIRSEQKNQPAMRPIICVTTVVKEKPLQIIINHWKSKSGGAEESEVWRNYQENVLANCFFDAQENNLASVACGDFNRDINEFYILQGRKNINNVQLRGSCKVDVYSPWYDSGNNLYTPGSYFFNNNWERIDHFFAGEEVQITDFKVENKGVWATESGKPFSYNVRYGSGFSDHFPISCTVYF